MTNTRKTVSFSVEFGNGHEEDVVSSYIDVGHGETVLFIHGFLSDSRTWLSIIQEIGKKYRCISIDLLGFGNSSKPDIEYLIREQVRYINAFADKISLNHFHVIGHSLGAWIATRYTLDYPLSVLSLMLLAPAGYDEELDKYQILKPLSWRVPIIDLLLRLSSNYLPNISQVNIELLMHYRYSLLHDPVIIAWFKRIFRKQLSTELVDRLIHRIQVNTLIVAAENDKTIPLHNCRAYARLIPRATLQVLPGVDHQLPTNSPKMISCLFMDLATGL